MGRRIILLVFCLAFLTISNLQVQQASAQTGDNLTPHGPIHIVGNDNFTPANGVAEGNGIEDDPYIIANWRINSENGDGIKIDNTTSHFIIRNCYIDRAPENRAGIGLVGVENGSIENCTLENNNVGIGLITFSSNNIIERNKLSSNSIGVYFDWSSNNHVNNNSLNEDAIALDFSDNNEIIGNTVESGFGITLGFSQNNSIENNIVKSNKAGIWLLTSPNNTVVNNTVSMSEDYGIFLTIRSENNRIYHNHLESNETQAYDIGSNYWDNGSEGNYWSDYEGEDKDGDGIGDVPYLIPGDNNQDRYPLVPSPTQTSETSTPPLVWIVLITIIASVAVTAFILKGKS